MWKTSMKPSLTFLNTLEEFDPKAERSSVVRRDVERVASCYTLLYQEKKHMFNFLLTNVSRKLIRHHQCQQKSLLHLSLHQNPLEVPLLNPLQNHHQQALHPTTKMCFFCLINAPTTKLRSADFKVGKLYIRLILLIIFDVKCSF
jgi:hypothetical protein